jgi:hypothetical protein
MTYVSRELLSVMLIVAVDVVVRLFKCAADQVFLSIQIAEFA